MATVARADVNEIVTEGEVFRFEDGTRQVSAADIEKLNRYTANGGPARITYEEQTTSKSRKGKES